MPNDDTDFFIKVIEQDVLTKAIREHGFLKPSPYDPTGGSRTPGLKILKRDWSLPPSGDRIEGVGVHFEFKRPRHFYIHVEIEPYDNGKSIKPNDPRLVRLADELRTKAELLASIRSRIMEDETTKEESRATISGLGDTDKPNTNGAVKFEGLSDDCSPHECAEFLAGIIAKVTKFVDLSVAEQYAARG